MKEEIKKVVESIDMDSYMKSKTVDRIVELHKNAMLETLYYISLFGIPIFVGFFSLLADVSLTDLVLYMGMSVLTVISFIGWIKNMIRAKFIAKNEHRSLYITPKNIHGYSVYWYPNPVEEIEVGKDNEGNTWCMSKHICQEGSDIPYIMLLHRNRFGDNYKYSEGLKYYWGVDMKISMTYDILLELRTLPKDMCPIEVMEEIPVPFAVVLDCPKYREEAFYKFGHPAFIELGQKALEAYDTIECRKLKELIRLQQSTIQQLKSTLEEADRFGYMTFAHLIDQKETFGKTLKEEEANKSIWERLGTKGKVISLFTIISVCLIVIFFAVMLGGGLG